jgi:ribosomal protein S18 acetylase RimI-like enzyme
MEAAVLGVDADNPSGALGLYESVGFAATERFVAYRRPLEVHAP